ncbi:MAG TPA: restriction endonuclease subunit S, partial [Sphingomicrobium sp.]|nr:restriction endonuclease subunit S [Sphingomicrobium sp.]
RLLNRRCNPEEGDIVMSKSGALGSVAVFHDRGSCSFFESLALIKPNRDLVMSRYLAEFLRTPVAQRQLSKATKGVAVRHLHLADIKEVRLPLPPMEAQMHFVERIEAVESQRRVAEAQHERLRGLFSSLQQRAFRGEL